MGTLLFLGRRCRYPRGSTVISHGRADPMRDHRARARLERTLQRSPRPGQHSMVGKLAEALDGSGYEESRDAACAGR